MRLIKCISERTPKQQVELSPRPRINECIHALLFRPKPDIHMPLLNVARTSSRVARVAPSVAIAALRVNASVCDVYHTSAPSIGTSSGTFKLTHTFANSPC